MRLTGIFLYPDLAEFRTAAQSFRTQTRFICHYVQRFVAARKVQADGFKRICTEQHLPVEAFKEAVESFRALGYKNQWVHSAKAFRPLGLKCRLLCELDLSAFHLILEVEREGKLYFSQEILRTLPDELMYAHRFKDLRLDGQTLHVQDRFGESLFALNVA